MLFNSLQFLIFGIIFFALWPLFKRRDTPRCFFLTAASFIFYGCWDWRFLFLLTGSGVVDYLAALSMRRSPQRKKVILAVSLIANLGALSVFKYSAFLAQNIDHLLGMVGLNISLATKLPEATYILPVGISFYTFQSLSYTIDVYKGKIEPVRNPLHFFAYLAMFPQLVAGPIVRASEMLKQLKSAPRTTEEQRWQGCKLLANGFFKKMVMADNLAPFVDAAFQSDRVAADPLYWLLTISMFSFQIYYDFSGYSDIARGLIKWMGYDIGLNFDHPYTATSLRDFWQRWHISLSTWFRDYVYIPLGGSRTGALLAYRNLWASFLLSGLWHGAAWNFVIWGGLHALFLQAERIFQWPTRLEKLRFGRAFSTLSTLLVVWLCWVFFRAESLEQAVLIIGAMIGLAGDGAAPPIGKTELAFLTLGVARELYIWLGLNTSKHLENIQWLRACEPVAVSLLFLACIFLRGTGNAFIYFQF